MRRLLCLAVSMVFGLSTIGCDSTPVASDVGQREANQIVSVLYKKGIGATLEARRAGRGGFTVHVASEDFARAATVLHAVGLPNKQQPTFAEMTASNGIIPVSREIDNLRLDRALAAELEDSFLKLTAVEDAAVIVRKHSARASAESSATVILRLLHNDNSLSAQSCMDVVRNSLPTIKDENILISFAQTSVEQQEAGALGFPDSYASFMFFWRVPRAIYMQLVVLFVGIVLLVGIVAGASGYLIGQYRLLRRGLIGRSVGRRAVRTEEQSVASESLSGPSEDEL
jgi:type III secretory pathway lipoprotein EscJ